MQAAAMIWVFWRLRPNGKGREESRRPVHLEPPGLSPLRPASDDFTKACFELGLAQAHATAEDSNEGG